MTTKAKQKKNRKIWVEALRSGKYEQGKHYLKCENKFCCLGVAVEVLAPEEFVKEEDGMIGIPYGAGFLYGSLNDKVQNLLGLKDNSGAFKHSILTTLNDRDGLSFAEIADIIESEPEGLFE